jgi:HlyD family secretion protein
MENQSTIFRRVALERLSTPEQLDQAMRVTSPLSWLMMIAVGVMAVAAVLLGVFGTAPVKVSAQGILISPGGVLTISSDSGGRILQLMVAPGQSVSIGQVIARIEQSDLRQELETARRELAELQSQKQQIIDFQDRDMKVQLGLLAQKKSDLKQQVSHVRERIKWLEERSRNEARLLEKQIIDRQRFINTKIDLNTAYEDLARASNEIKQIERDETALTIDHERELLDKEMTIGAAERKIDALAARLDRQTVVVSSYAGQVVEAKANVGDIVDKGGELLTVLPSQADGDDNDDLVAIVYVPPNDGKKVRPGMTAQIAPTMVKREEYGFIQGKVRSVAEIPSSAEGMQRTLKNAQLVEALSGGGAPFEVVIDLERDPSTPSGFRWSSSRGPDGDINTGALADAQVTVREIHLISLVIPALEQMIDR